MIKLNLNQDKIGGGGKKLCEGRFRVRIEKVLAKESKRPGSGDQVIAEFTVLEVFNKKPSKNWKGEYLDGDVGDRRSYTWDMKYGDMAVGAVTAFTAACVDVDPHNPKALREAVAPDGKLFAEKRDDGRDGFSHAFDELQGADNPAHGVVLDVEMREHITDAKRTKMLAEWFPVVEEQPAAA